MILVIAGDGPLGTAIVRELTAAEPVRKVLPDDPDLFMKALGCWAVVYAPSPSLLAGALEPSPDPSRMRAVLGACEAPPVRLLVCVEPARAEFEAEEQVLRRYGKPYVILRSAPLAEELSAEAGLEASGSVWLPAGRHALLSRAELAARAVRQALDDDAAQGKAIHLGAERMDVAEAMRAAAPARHKVRAVPPLLSRARRSVERLRGREAPRALSLSERLLAAQGAAPAE